jgi:hypothetical protein
MPPVDLLDHLPRDNKLQKSGMKSERGRQDQDASLELVEAISLQL